MENKMIAYCGLDCSKCDAYLATINNDEELRIKTAAKWSELNNIEIKSEEINCEGCRTSGVKTIFCDKLCPIRRCAINNKVNHCGKCQKMISCDTLKMITSNNKDALNNLRNN